MIQVREQYGNIYVRILDTMQTFDYTMNKIRQIDQRSFKMETGEWMFPKESIGDLLNLFENQIIWFQPLREIVGDLPVKPELVKKHLSWEDDNDFKNWNFQPYPYQRVACHFLADRGQAATFDGVGLGKTPEILGASQILFNKGKAKRALIVTLSSIKQQWAKEVKKFMNKEAIAVYGTQANRVKAIEEFASDESIKFMVINYEMLRSKIYLDRILDIGFDIVALDEAQKIKTGVTDKMLNLKPSQNALGAYALKSIPYRFLATATPIQSKAEEVWSLYYFLDENILGSWEYFREKYCKYHSRFGINGYQNEGELFQQISPHFIRRTKEMPEIQQQLPKVKHDHIFLEMNDSQEKIENHLLNKIDDIKDISRSVSPNGKVINGNLLNQDQAKEYYDGLLQGYTQFLLASLDSPALFKMSDSGLAKGLLSDLAISDSKLNRSPKLEHLKEFYTQLMHDEPSSKVVIFTRFERMSRLIQNVLPGSLRYTGQMSENEKQYAVNEFINNPMAKVIILTDAGSTGLNLQVANYLINFDLPWDPTLIEQRNGRVDRTGNPFPNITIQYYIMSGSYEEHLLELLNKKAELANSILEGGEIKKDRTNYNKLALERLSRHKQKK